MIFPAKFGVDGALRNGREEGREKGREGGRESGSEYLE
jgi:predicted transposase YdaD